MLHPTKSNSHHKYQDLINLFNTRFAHSHNTRLVKGGDEPLYSPVSDDCQYHQIIFAHGYYASALHEVAPLVYCRKRASFVRRFWLLVPA